MDERFLPVLDAIVQNSCLDVVIMKLSEGIVI